MKIVVHDYSGHPFQVQLSRSLARRGHEVTHIYSRFFQTPKGSLDRLEHDPASFNIIGLDIGEEFVKNSYVKRRFQEIAYGRLLAKTIKGLAPELVVSSNNPLDPQNILLKECKASNIRFFFWLQDVYSVAIYNILRKKIPILGNLIGRHYQRLERRLLRESDGIIAITEDFIPVLRKWDVTTSKISVIPNWAPIEEVEILDKCNTWSLRHKIHNNFCFLYSGTLGFKHNPDMLLRLADEYRNEPDVKIVVISEGNAVEWLKTQCDMHGLNNLIFLGFQPFHEFAKVLASADVLVAILESEAGVYSVPSKVLTYMCSGKPMLLSVPVENLAAKIVVKNRAGYVSAPENLDLFLKYSRNLFDNQEIRLQMGENARRYAETYFDITKITNDFENAIGIKGI